MKFRMSTIDDPTGGGSAHYFAALGGGGGGGRGEHGGDEEYDSDYGDDDFDDEPGDFFNARSFSVFFSEREGSKGIIPDSNLVNFSDT